MSERALPQTIAEAAAWLRDGRITAVALTEALLARCHAAQPTLAAFNIITDEPARAAARAADADFARGVDRGPLQGIPLGVKDIIATADAPTTANSRVLDPAWGQRADATVVRRLRAAGAVLLGKLVLHEFAIGWPDPATGFAYARNPWDLARSPGGSSSGTGAAVSAGLVLGGLGTDTGGSIRGPAAYCNISGLKPTFGRVSKEGCVPLAWSLDSIGPMARTARDCALLFDVLAGFDPLDPCSVNLPTPPYATALDGSLAGVRLGVPRDYFFNAPALDDGVKAAVLAAGEAMAAAGAVVREIDLPLVEEARTAQQVIVLSEGCAYHEADLRTRPEAYGAYTRQTFLPGALFTAVDYVQANRLRSVVHAGCLAAMAEVDVVITPTMPTVAPTFAEFDLDSRLTRPAHTGYWNFVGFPALSVGCGFVDGLPVGMQIVGRPFDEATILRVGDAYQRITDWHTQAPAFALAQEASA